MEQQIMRNADHIIANTRENRQVYLQSFDLPPTKVSTIPNGFDPSDIPEPLTASNSRRRFRIGYMGALSKSLFPWRIFLNALTKLADNVGHQNIEFVYCGYHSSDVDSYVKDNDIGSIFSYHGLLTHSDAMQLMVGTDMQLVLLYETSESYAIVPQKLYNYLAIDGPIFAIAPEHGAVARMINETNCGDVVSPSRGADAAYDVLKKYYDLWSINSLDINADFDAIARYDRRSQIREIADLIRRVID